MLANNKQQFIPPPQKIIRDNRLSNVEWKEFVLSDVFTIQPGKRLTKADMVDGDTPFIGATDSNNGITAWVGNKNESADQNVLGVNYNGSVVETFYHPYKCIFSDDVKRLHLKKDVEDVGYVMLFIKSIILKQKEKYAYGYKFNEKRMQKQIILLPVAKDGEPDYVFMASFMKDVEKDILGTTLKYFEDKTRQDKTRQDKTRQDKTRQDKTRQDEWGLEVCQYKDFMLRDIFTILEPGKSKGLNHLSIADNGISYLGATNVNNGVLGFVAPVKSMIQKGNCIAFIRNGEGSMGYAVYKAEDFIATSDMTIGYNEHLNKYIGCYITTIADRIRGKYNFGYKRNAQRLAKEILTLPVTDDGTPDWDYMEAYMKQIECDKILQYLRYIAERVA